MEEKDKENLKQFLVQLRDEIIKNLDNNEDDLSSSMKDSSGEHSSYSFHLADLGTDTSEREKSFMMAAKESDVLYDIENALKKFQTNEYGICEKCGGDISLQRLEALPYAKLCLDCKSKEEITR